MRPWSRVPRRRGVWQLAWMAILLLFVQANSVSSAFATTFNVTKTADTNDGDCSAIDCSLREAIVAANANIDADLIVLGIGLTYTLSLGAADPAGVLVPGSGDLDIHGGDLTIQGNGSTVDGGGIDRVFDIQGALTVTIDNLTIRGGVARGFLSLGGGLNIRGASVVLTNGVVTANSTLVESGERDAGGGIAVVGSFNAATGAAALASLTLTNTTVSNNTGSTGGGIVCVLCVLSTSNSSITGNAATSGDGGGVALTGNSSTCSVTGSAITLNAVSGGGARGGGLSMPVGTSTTTLSRTRIVSNAATTGSAVFNNQATITATNNWWGCNFGPGAGGAGCAGTPNGVAGTVAASPFLVLTSRTSRTFVLPGESSTMTADVTFNSSSADTSSGGAIPNGTPITFSATLGTLTSPSSTTTNGKATVVYTAGGVQGIASLSASLDGQTVSSLLRIGGTLTAPTGLRIVR
jgi:CSLREA domain-containing protein